MKAAKSPAQNHLSDLYFNRDYPEARAAFLHACRRIQQENPAATLQSFRVPSKIDQDLYVDDFYIPPTERPDHILILTSGVHGIEGPAGSACQTMFLTEILKRESNRNCGFYLVHSINPFGFKYLRRATENNVNLNRAFAPEKSLFESQNAAYRRVHDLLVKTRKLGSLDFQLATSVLLLGNAFLLRGFNPDTLNRAVAQGQYDYSNGLEFGGKQFEPQIEYVVGRLRSLIPPFKNIVHYDFHTGLGDPGVLHLIPGDIKGALDQTLLDQIFHQQNEKEIYHLTTTDTEGFYQTTGDFNSLFPAIAAPQQKILSLTLEYGTIGNGPRQKIQTFHRLRIENQAYLYGYSSPKLKAKIDEYFIDLFSPEDAHWRETVLTKARNVLANTLRRI